MNVLLFFVSLFFFVGPADAADDKLPEGITVKDGVAQIDTAIYKAAQTDQGVVLKKKKKGGGTVTVGVTCKCDGAVWSMTLSSDGKSAQCSGDACCVMKPMSGEEIEKAKDQLGK